MHAISSFAKSLQPLLATVLVSGFAWAAQTFEPVYDLDLAPGSADNAPMLVAHGAALDGDIFGSTILTADVNGDGRGDLIVAADSADVASPLRADAGALYIWFGRAALTGNIDAKGTFGTAPDVTIQGGTAGDRLTMGDALVLGDVNADGRVDLILGAPLADGQNNLVSNAGEVYVVFGRATFPAVIDLATQGANGADVVIYGSSAGDNLSLDGALKVGDVNGDGVVDVVIGAAKASGPNEFNSNVGEAYVVYGRAVPNIFPSVIDLTANSISPADLTFYGDVGADQTGDALTGGGAMAIADINGDGFGDIILGAVGADGQPEDVRLNCGEVYIIFGGGPLLTPVMDVKLAAGVTITGGSANDNLTANGALSIGNVNGDALPDLLLGAPFGDGPTENRADAGEAYVLTGRLNWPLSVDLAVIDATSRTTIYGASAGDHLTQDMTPTVADLNDDGVGDLILGARDADGPADARSNSGEAYLILGRTPPLVFPGTVDLAVQGAGGADVTLFGRNAGGQLTRGAEVAVADVNADGITDLVLGFPFSTGNLGGAQLVLGRTTFPTTLDLAVQGSAGAETTFLANSTEKLGGAHIAAGDINADGVADILISPIAHQATGAPFRTSGKVFVVSGLAPKISVEQPENTVLADGASQDFGDVLVGTNNSITFTLRNDGGGALNNFVITRDGPHAAMFTVTKNPTAPVASGATTTFIVRFTPTSEGAKTAAIHISSNGVTGAAFDLNLTGDGVAKPVVKTLAATLASILDTTATVNGSIDPENGNWDLFFDYGKTTAYGMSVPADPASATGPNVEPVTKNLTGLDPHTKYNFRLRATNGFGTVTGANLTFTTDNNPPVAVNDPFNVRPEAKVVLNVTANDGDPDGDAPVIVSFKQPLPAKSGTVAKSGNTLVFTASSTFAGASFTYVIKDGFGGTSTATVDLALATLDLAPPGPLNIASAGGTQDVTVTSNGAWSVVETLPWVTTSTVGNVVTLTILPNPATKTRTGNVKIGGQIFTINQDRVFIPVISMGAVPDAIVSGDFALEIVTTNRPVTYKVTKMPPGLTINNNDGFIRGKPTTPGTYPVTVQASNAAGKSNVLSFDIIVDALDEDVVGTYHGFIARDPALNGDLGSRFELVTTSKGTFTGKILTGTTSTPIKGALDSDPLDPDHPEVNLTLTRKGASNLKLSLTLDATTDALTGTLTDDPVVNTTGVEAWRNTWTATNQATNYTALHTFRLRQADPSVLLPQGFGYGSFKAVAKTGAVTVAGKLADNSVFTTGTFLGTDGQVLVYQSLYANKGSFGGKLTVTLGATVDDTAIAGTPTWLKPAPLPTSRDTIYRPGFGPISLIAEGGTYIPPAKGAVIMGFVDADNKAQLDFESPSLTDPEEPDLIFSIRSITNSTNNKVTVPTFASGNNPKKVTFTLNTATGLFSGGFTIPGVPASKNRVGTYFGLAVRVAGVYEGAGFSLVAEEPEGSETVATAPKNSGTVRLLKIP